MFRMGGINIGKYFGIPVFIHPSWFFILLLLTFSLGEEVAAMTTATPVAAYAAGLIASVLAFATLLAHEYGHALTARWFGIDTDRITLFMLGGVAQIKAEPRRPVEELVVALAGPAVSIFCMFLFGGLYFIAQRAGASELIAQPLRIVANVNLFFALFNLLPGFPMDGGRVLRAIVWMITGNHLQATRIAFYGGKTISYFLIATGFFIMFIGTGTGLVMVLTGFFLNKLAQMAYRDAQLKSAFEHVQVLDLMRPVQVVVPAELTLRDVVRQFIYRIHSDRFPVVKGQTLLGYISADDIAAVDRPQWDNITAERLARPYGRADILTPDQDALLAFQKATQSGRPQLPVFRGRELIGYLFVQDVINYMRRFKLS